MIPFGVIQSGAEGDSPAPSCSANLTGDEVSALGLVPMETIEADYAETIDPGEQRGVSTPRFVVDWEGTRTIAFDITAEEANGGVACYEFVESRLQIVVDRSVVDGDTITFRINGDGSAQALLNCDEETIGEGTIDGLSNECIIIAFNDQTNFGSMTVTANAETDGIPCAQDQDWCGNDFPSAPSANLTGDVATDLGTTPFETINDDQASTDSTELRNVSTPMFVHEEARELEIEIVNVGAVAEIALLQFDSEGNPNGFAVSASEEFGQGDHVNVVLTSSEVVSLYINGNTEISGNISTTTAQLAVLIANGTQGGPWGPMEIQTYAALEDQQFNQSGNGW